MRQLLKAAVYCALFVCRTETIGAAATATPAMTIKQFADLARVQGCATAEAAIAQQPDPEFFFGAMYELGLCHDASPADAIEHYVKSAEHGNSEAMYEVFFVIAKQSTPEHHISKDEYDLARTWLVRAGELNNWRAAMVLALCYEKGCFGLPIDSERSRHYKEVFDRGRPPRPVEK